MIQIIIQIMTHVLFFWRRGVKGGVEAAFSLDEQDQACQVCARKAGFTAASNCRERWDGKGPPRPEFEQLVQAVRDSKVDVVYVHDGGSSSRKLRTYRRDEWCSPLRRCSVMEQIAESSEYQASLEAVSKPIAEQSDAELPVAVYCREQMHRQDDSTLDAQVRECVEQAHEDGERVDPVYVYRERGSGLDIDRALLGRLREAVQAGKVRAVYLRSPDRLTRSLRNQALLEEEFASAGVELRFVQGAVGKAGSLVRALYDYDHYGRMEPSMEDGARGEEFNAVELMFKLARAGWSCARIAAELNRMELPSESSAEWNASNLRQTLEKWVDAHESTD